MTLSLSTVDADLRDVARLQLCVSVLGLLLVWATWPLWYPAGDYPLIPWFWAMLSVPAGVDRALALGIVLSGTGVALFSAGSWMRCRRGTSLADSSQRGLAIANAVWLACFVGSAMLDQQRFQVWGWEFVWLTLFLNLASPRVALLCCRVLVIGIYFYSAISKFDAGFVQSQGPWLWQGIQRALGWEAPTWGRSAPIGMLVFPAGELLVAIALCFRRGRRWGIAGSWVMHLGLLLALGPWGWDQKPGVLLWNGFFLLSVPLLFWPKPILPDREPRRSLLLGERFSVAAVLGLSVWPALSGIGLCDHWPAWEVYSSRPEVVLIQIADEQVARLPPSLQSHVGPAAPLSPWRPISIDHWSFEQRHCPTYPQARYRLAVARHLEMAYGVTLHVTEQSTPDRWTGTRQSREIGNLASDTQQRFWFNTLSRGSVPARSVSFDDRLIALTAQLSVACYALALLLAARQPGGVRPSVGVAGFWTAGLLGLTIHVACAFHFLHHWSHAAALKHTAQRTAEVTGWDWPGGLYINYAFLVFWAVDVVRIWREALGRVPVATPLRRRIVQGVFLFMMFNATVVFGPWHWTVVCIAFAIGWGLTRFVHSTAPGLQPGGVPPDPSLTLPSGSPADDRPG